MHTHSTFSDGVLTPAELVRRADLNGVSMLALTDHDDTGGVAEAQQASVGLKIHVIAGVEISTVWNGHTVHVLGLDIDAQSAQLSHGLDSIRCSRGMRAQRIAAQLDAAGIEGSLQGAARHAGKSAAIGRSHFARFLVEHKHARNTSDAFTRYLGAGRLAYVSPCWPELRTSISWIHSAGGQAVLAHPSRYRLAPRQLESLLEAFAQGGGDAIEITGEGQIASPAQIRQARQFGFALSSGSDFHAPGKNVADLGDVTRLPAGCPTVWSRVRTVR